MRNKSWLLGIVTMGVIGSALLSAACTSTPTGPAGSSESNLGADQAPSSSKPAPSASSSSTPTSPSVAGSPGTTPSVSTSGGPSTGGQNDTACYDACDAQHPTGSSDYDDAESACLCAASRCATACAQSACSNSDNAPDPVDGDACSVCTDKFENDDGTGECDTQIEAALKAKGGDDAALVACYDACP